jgi:hypothetical protein
MTHAISIQNITIDNGQATRLHCPACETWLDIALPAPVSEWLAVSQSFITRHNLCSRANIPQQTAVFAHENTAVLFLATPFQFVV